METICPVSGECTLFGRKEDYFTEWFQDIRKCNIASIKPIGGISANGFVRELKVTRGNYDGYVILKSNVERENGVLPPDNLYYEFRVGIYLNSLMKKFPIFVKTYGIYEYLPTYKATMQNNPEQAIEVIQKLIGTTMQRSIEAPENMCIVVQQVHKSISFKSLLQQYQSSPTVELKHEILCILYQIYFVLPLVPFFTHNDLHEENVILTPAENKYYQYEFTRDGRTFSFQCRYAAKIIDYGRCFCAVTEVIKKQLEQYSKEQQTYAGYPWNAIADTPCPLADFTLLIICILYSALDSSFLNSIKKKQVILSNTCNSSLYHVYTLMKKINPGLKKKGIPKPFINPDTNIDNVSSVSFEAYMPDMYDVVTQLEKIMEPHTYDLPCACTIHVSDVEDMRVDWPLTAGKRKHSRRRRRRTRRR